MGTTQKAKRDAPCPHDNKQIRRSHKSSRPAKPSSAELGHASGGSGSSLLARRPAVHGPRLGRSGAEPGTRVRRSAERRSDASSCGRREGPRARDLVHDETGHVIDMPSSRAAIAVSGEPTSGAGGGAWTEASPWLVAAAVAAESGSMSMPASCGAASLVWRVVMERGDLRRSRAAAYGEYRLGGKLSQCAAE